MRVSDKMENTEYGPDFQTELQMAILLISSHFEHYGSVSVARAQYICIGHGARSRFRSVRSEMKSTVQRISLALNKVVYSVP